MQIIIIGSEGLIGREVCKYLQARGHSLLKLDLRLGHDVSDERFVKDWFSQHRGDALVNLFALNDHVDESRPSNCLSDISLDSFRRYLEINLTCLFSVCRQFAANNKAGSIVNFASTYGLVSPCPDLYDGDEKHIGYGVSKAGVIQLTKHLAVHLAPGIRVNCIAPGGVRHNQSEHFVSLYSKHTPLKRMMDVSEIAPLVEYLASEAAGYCTGSVFSIDGGWTAW